MLGEDGAIEIAVPRDRNSSFEPRLSPRGRPASTVLTIGSSVSTLAACRFARSRLIFEELYGVEVSPDLISRVTDAVLEDVREWQNHRLTRSIR